jgi:hypothetical protein
MAWMVRKFKRFMGRKTKAGYALERLTRTRSDLFAHWKIGIHRRQARRVFVEWEFAVFDKTQDAQSGGRRRMKMREEKPRFGNH